LIIIYQPSHGRNLAAWLSDSRFWGQPIYPGLEASFVSIIIAGFAIFLILFILAVTQAYRLEGVQRELKLGGRMSSRSLFMLLWPLIFVALTSYVTNNNTRNNSTRDALLVQEAINTGRTYEGDLFQLSLEQGVNYNAISGVREMMGPTYSLLIGDFDADALTTFVVAHFDNGAWITCRIINGQLNFCYDAAPPYTISLAALINGEELPEECRGCLLQVDEETGTWLHDQKERLGDNPMIERIAQKGSHVLMRVTSESADQAIECWFKGSSPVELVHCEIVNP
jgi:hypothetical protein